MSDITDADGIPAKVGDRIAFATRVGNSAELRIATVLEVLPHALKVQSEGKTKPATIGIVNGYYNRSARFVILGMD